MIFYKKETEKKVSVQTWAGLRKLKTDPRVSRTEEEVVLRMGVLVGSGTPKRDAIWLKGDLG